MKPFKKAIQILNKLEPKIIKVFAPTGMWNKYDNKEAWLMELASISLLGTKVSFIYGGSKNKNKQKTVNKRLEILKEGKVFLKEIPPQDKKWSGFIIIDDLLLMLDNAGNLKQIRSKECINLLEGGFDILWHQKK